MSQLHRITINPNQWGGRPCIRGLRIRVKHVLEGKVRRKVASRKRRAILRKQLVRRFWSVAGVGGDAAGAGVETAQLEAWAEAIFAAASLEEWLGRE